MFRFLDAAVLLYQNLSVDDVITNMCSKEISWFSDLAQMYMHVVSYCMVTFLGYGMHALLIFFIPFVSRHCVSRSGHITFPSKDCMLQDFVIVNYFVHALREVLRTLFVLVFWREKLFEWLTSMRNIFYFLSKQIRVMQY